MACSSPIVSTTTGAAAGWRADRSCDEGELAETRCLHTLLDHIAETGYEITGDYVGEVVLDSELFSFSGRDELIKLQVPVRKRA